MSVLAWIIAPLWILSGLVIYRIYGGHHASPSEASLEIIEEKIPEKLTSDRVLLALANPRNVRALTDVARVITRDSGTTVEFIHMISVPDPMALADGDSYLRQGKEAIEEAREYLGGIYPTASTIRYCRNISRGIITTAKQRHSHTVIMGWQGRQRSSHFFIGSTIDPVVRKIPGNVILVKGDVIGASPHSVLVPLFGNLNDALAMKIAEYILPDEGGRITALYSNRARMRPGHIHNILENIVTNESIKIVEINTSAKRFERHIMGEIKFHDTMVLGINEPPTHRLGISSATERIAAGCDRPMILVKTNTLFSRWAKRLV